MFAGLTIGIPKEIMVSEDRVAATPETVAKMVENGARVLVQKGAGEGSFFSDPSYLAAGAELVDEVFSQSDLILKVKEPQFNTELGKHEVELMNSGQTLICFLHPASPANHQMIRDLAQKGVISLTLDSIPRTTRAQPMDALTSMSTVAGYKGVLMAADRLPKFMPMLGTAVGMVRPAQVLVIGAGVAGLQAIATARRLGAVVYACDIRPDACEQAKSLGAKILDLGIPPEHGVGEGGYARRLPKSWLLHEQEVLREMVQQADIIILTALVPGKRAPILVTQEMVQGKAPGSVIVDISIDQGGNCELTQAGQTVDYNGVLIDGTKNIPGSVPTSATWLFAQNILNFATHLFSSGKMNLEDEIIASSLVTHQSQIVHAGTLEAMTPEEG